jgi:hypothetical protein
MLEEAPCTLREYKGLHEAELRSARLVSARLGSAPPKVLHGIRIDTSVLLPTNVGTIKHRNFFYKTWKRKKKKKKGKKEFNFFLNGRILAIEKDTQNKKHLVLALFSFRFLFSATYK